jgi:hypothetical protein
MKNSGKEDIESGRYGAGRYEILKSDPDAAWVQEWIRSREFLDPEYGEPLSSGNLGTDLRRIDLPSGGRAVFKGFGVQPHPRASRELNRRLSLLFRNYARTSFRGALMLQRLGVGTPSPLAWWTYHEGVGRIRQYYLCRWARHECTLMDYRERWLRDASLENSRAYEEMIHSLALMCRRMHAHGVTHGDPAPHNVLVLDSAAIPPALAMVDTDHVRRKFYPAPLKQFFLLRDFRRLNLDRNVLPKDGVHFMHVFLKVYLGDAYRPGWYRAYRFWRQGALGFVREMLRVSSKR